MMAAMYSFENRHDYDLRKAHARRRMYLGENDEEQKGKYDELKRLDIEFE